MKTTYYISNTMLFHNLIAYLVLYTPTTNICCFDCRTSTENMLSIFISAAKQVSCYEKKKLLKLVCLLFSNESRYDRSYRHTTSLLITGNEEKIFNICIHPQHV